MRERFAALRRAPRELRLVYALKLLESFADFALSLNLVLYLTEAFGMSDAAAAACYGAWGVATSVFGMLFGAAIDRLGVRCSLLTGGALLTIGRIMIAGARTKAHALAAMLFVLPSGSSLAIPVLSIAIRRTTDAASRSVAFATFYAVMNMGALLSGVGTDALNAALRASLGSVGAMRALFWLAAAVSLLYTGVVFAWFRDLPVATRTEKHEQTTWQVMRATWRDAVFWRLCVFYGVLFGARSIFRHVDLT